MFCFSEFSAQDKDFEKFYKSWMSEYELLGIPATALDYHENFANIRPDSVLQRQEDFFTKKAVDISSFGTEKLDAENKIRYRQLLFETQQNLKRLTLEKKWTKGNRLIPPNGLYALTNCKEWYSYYVIHFTGLSISPEEVFKIGKSEVKKAQTRIEKITKDLGFKNYNELLGTLKKDDLWLTQKTDIISGFKGIDSTVRKNLYRCFRKYEIPPVEAEEWPGATASTPPGIYQSNDDGDLPTAVFRFNFSLKKYNKRCMEWLYMHEAIPGHHLQHTIGRTGSGIFYYGTIEGWACYIEDLGDSLGLYKSPYSKLGKEEWNLVRSARLVMEVGIHYYGWSFERAMKYWKKNIKGQDGISIREINRITNWPGQALCYKVGALTIDKVKDELLKQNNSLADAHDFILRHSDLPLEALR